MDRAARSSSDSRRKSLTSSPTVSAPHNCHGDFLVGARLAHVPGIAAAHDACLWGAEQGEVAAAESRANTRTGRYDDGAQHPSCEHVSLTVTAWKL